MNLASRQPAFQVAHVLCACPPDGVPDLPPFLIVDAAEQARRNEWAKAHPLPPQPKFMDRPADATKPIEVYVAPPKVVAPPKKRKTEPMDMTGFRWDPRRGRFIPEGYTPPKKTTAKVTPEEAALAAALHAANAQRGRPKAKKAAAPKPTGSAAPVPGKKVDGESKLETLIRLLKRPEGMTLEEGLVSGYATTDSVWARIGSNLKKQAGLLIDHTDEARGRVFRINE